MVLPHEAIAVGVTVAREVVATHVAALVVEEATVLGPGPIQDLAQGHLGPARAPMTVGKSPNAKVPQSIRSIRLSSQVGQS